MMNWIITSSLLIIIIVVLRFFLKGKISLRLQYSLWLLVLVRLLVPLSFGETAMSIHNWLDSVADTQEVQQIVEMSQTGLPSMSYNQAYDIVEEQYAQKGVDINRVPIEQLSETIEYEILDTMNGGYTPAEILTMIWIAGMLILTLWFIYTNIRFATKLRKNRVLLGTAGELLGRNNDKGHVSGELLQVYESNSIETPCLYGLILPAIYVTNEVSTQEKKLRHVLEHECTHYRHKDEIWSLLRVICLVLHWYNPLVWYAAILSRNDAELACDEATIARLGEDSRVEYGRTLIDLTCQSRVQLLTTATTMTGSAKSIKERIKLIAKKPKMAVFTVIALIFLVLFICVVIFTGPKSEDIPSSEETEEIVLDNTETDIVEQCFYETNADLNHDGIDDLIKLKAYVLNANKWWEEMDYNGVFVEVYLASSKETYSLPAVYTSDIVAASHSANATFVLTEKDGKDYLLYSLMYEMQGEATYTYSAMYIEGNSMVVAETNEVNFYCDPFQDRYWEDVPKREDVIPQFKAKIEPWIENGEILISYDVSTPTFVASDDEKLPASSYYDIVWAKSEEKNIKEFESAVGTEDWQQELFFVSFNYLENRKWIEEQLATDYSRWFWEYDGSKLQRIDTLGTSSNKGKDAGVPASSDIIFYRADSGENEQKVLYKMIEKMIADRMVAADNRDFVITDYAIPEQEIIPISEDMWMITFLKGYYSYEGSNLGTMQEFIDAGVVVTEDGLIPFMAQGSDDVFVYILMEKDGVYRLERLQQMME